MFLRRSAAFGPLAASFAAVASLVLLPPLTAQAGKEIGRAHV